MSESLTPRLDVERAALDAYSDALESRAGKRVRHMDHKAALMAAIDAVDALRARWSATPPMPTEEVHATPIGDTPQGALVVRPLGGRPPVRQEVAASDVAQRLTVKQRQALREVADNAPRFRDGITPRRFLRSATSTSLVNLGLLEKRGYPVIGYRLTERGKAVAHAPIVP